MGSELQLLVWNLLDKGLFAAKGVAGPEAHFQTVQSGLLLAELINQHLEVDRLGAATGAPWGAEMDGRTCRMGDHRRSR